MKEVEQKECTDGMYQMPFTLTCSKCGHKWVGKNEAECNEKVKTEVCECVKRLNNLSQDELLAELTGMNQNAVEEKPVDDNKPAPLKEVDW